MKNLRYKKSRKRVQKKNSGIRYTGELDILKLMVKNSEMLINIKTSFENGDMFFHILK